MTGHVSALAPSATAGTSGVIVYQVTILFDPTDAPLRAGMSATATITSNSRQDALLVPNRAILLERGTSKTYVERLVNGQPQKVEVRLGLRDEQQSEIRDGLTEGDQVVIRKVTSLERLQQTFGSYMQ